MAELFHKADVPQYFCWDRSYYESVEEQLKTLAVSRTIYVGNLSFKTTEAQIHETFSQAGPINRIIMGLNAQTKEPCGFCFVEYFTREAAAASLSYINNTICDERVLRCDLDGGFRPGRQFGRGKSGGQRRDDYRREYDAGRDSEMVQNQLAVLGKRRHHTSRATGRPRAREEPRLEITVINDPVNKALSEPRYRETSSMDE